MSVLLLLVLVGGVSFSFLFSFEMLTGRVSNVCILLCLLNYYWYWFWCCFLQFFVVIEIAVVDAHVNNVDIVFVFVYISIIQLILMCCHRHRLRAIPRRSCLVPLLRPRSSTRPVWPKMQSRSSKEFVIFHYFQINFVRDICSF